MKKVYRFSKIDGNVSIGKRKEICCTLDLWYDSISNGDYTLVLERAKNPRSVSQNNLMWMWFTAIASEWSDACGKEFTSQMVHDAYCMLFLPNTLPDGRTVGGSTSKLTTEEMTEFLNKVQADAATEYGISLPTPDDLRFEEWRQIYK